MSAEPTPVTTAEDWTQWQNQVVNDAFALRRCLGRSDHSAVFLTEYKARNLADATIKFVRADSALGASQLARWEAAARLSHPHLSRLFEVGRWAFGGQEYFFVVMEYADQTLAQILSRRALDHDEVKELLVPTLDALGFLHRQQWIHGGLKPSNILAVDDQLKLAGDTVVSVGDGSGGIVTSSPYDAPEIKSRGRSAASDVWSLGVVLVEALTQRVPSPSDMAALLAMLPAPYADSVRRCLSSSPGIRPSVSELEAKYKVARAAAGPGPAAPTAPTAPAIVPAPRASEQKAAHAVNTPVPAPAPKQKATPPVPPQTSVHKGTPPIAQPAPAQQATQAVPPQPSKHQAARETPPQAPERNVAPAVPPQTSQHKAAPSVPREASENQAPRPIPSQAPEHQPTPAAPIKATEHKLARATTAQTFEQQPTRAVPSHATAPPSQTSEQRPTLVVPQQAPEHQPAPAVRAQASEQQIARSTLPQAPEHQATRAAPQAVEHQATRAASAQSSEHQGTREIPQRAPESQAARARRAQASEEQAAREVVAPASLSRPRMLMVVAAAVVISLAAWIGLRSSGDSQDRLQPASAAVIEPTDAPSVEEPSATLETPVPPVPPAPPEQASSPAVVHEVTPTVPQKISDKIQGRIYVTVRVLVDPSGNVIAADLESPGPSKYFARLADNAAREWKFEPTEDQASRVWLVRFQFTRDGIATRVFAQ